LAKGSGQRMLLHEQQIVETAPRPTGGRRELSSRARRKILFVTQTVEYGGLERHLLDMIRKFREVGDQAAILNLGPDLYTERLVGDEIGQVIVMSKSEHLSFSDWFHIFRRVRPDVVVFSCGWVWAFQWYAPLAAWLAGVRRRFSIQHLFPPPVSRAEGKSVTDVLRRLIGRRTRRLMGLRVSAFFCHKIICVSNSVRGALVNVYRFPASKTITIYNGVSVTKFVPPESDRDAVRPRLGIGTDEFLLVCAARLSDVKRVDILLTAMAQVLREGVQCKCVIVGDGPLRDQLSTQALSLGLAGSVFFEGFREDVRPYYQTADVFVLTSRLEGLPLSILQAMACGLPCIVTDVGGNAEAIQHHVHGLVVPPESANAVASAISYLATHPNERARMSKMARTTACQVFNIDNRIAEIASAILS
jgi:glycosyltransferase involved in cell wall biosynthesis